MVTDLQEVILLFLALVLLLLLLLVAVREAVKEVEPLPQQN